MLVDDEPLARRGLRHLLEEIGGLEIVAEAGTVEGALPLVEEHLPDALFLDIQMPGADGFHLLSRLGSPPLVVFVTAHSEHAIRAFDVHAVDYLLKPVSPVRLADAIARLRGAIEQSEDRLPLARSDTLCLRTPQRTLVAPLDALEAVEADGDFSRYYVAKQPPLLICRSLTASQQTLPTPPFLRLSRSLLINTSHLLDLRSLPGGRAMLTLRGTETAFTLGRSALARLRRHLQG